MSGTAPTPAQNQGPDRGPSLAVPAVLLATALVIVLATWAAAIGPDRVFEGEPRAEESGSARTTDLDVTPGSGDPVERDDNEDRGWGSTVLFGLEIVLLLVLVTLLVLFVRWVRLDIKEEGRRRKRRRRPVDFEVLPATPEQAAEEIVRDADAQLALLREGAPRNGIVACWHRFEVQARTAGMGREPWETSAEFTLRVLDLVAADEHSVAELAELYREARFSDHELGEAAREAAVHALERIHRSIGVPARSTT